MIFSASDCALEVFSLKSDILGCKQGQGHTAQFLTLFAHYLKHYYRMIKFFFLKLTTFCCF